MNVAAWIAALALACIHIFAGRLRFLSYVPRSRWLSFAGGVSVAYVFVHLLPELREHQRIVGEQLGETWDIIEHHIYLLSLLGLTIFYGLERLALTSRQDNRQEGEGDETSPSVFWVHIGSFTIYNVLIGYLLFHREESTTLSLVLYATAMGLHFLINDLGLREHHKQMYHTLGRWILAGAVIVGCLLGAFTSISELVFAVMIALLSGGVILNVLKEELPEDRESRFWAFTTGVVTYSLLLLLV